MVCTGRSRPGSAVAAVVGFVCATGVSVAWGQGEAQPTETRAEAAAEAAGPASEPVGGEGAAEAAEGPVDAATEAPETVEPESGPPSDESAAEVSVEVGDADARIAALEERIEGLESVLYAPHEDERQVLRIYGFTDVGFRFHRLLDGCTDTSLCIEEGKTPSRFRNLIDEYPSFVLGNLNLYFDAEPVESFRMLTEVRLSRYPQGVESGLEFARQDNEIYDYTSSTGRNRVTWSGIILERAQLEWNRYDAIRVTAGYFLTPYGIWNVDHGTPTLISLALPTFFAIEYIPTHLTGLQVHGRTDVGPADFGYHAYVANGRSPTVLDNNPGKGIGGRAFVEWQEPFRTMAGLSGYYEHYVDRPKEVVDLNSFTIDSDRTVDYQDWSIAADLSIDIGRTRFRGEYVLNRVDYEDGFRASPVLTRYAPDEWRQNFYVLLAHEIGKTGFEPYLYGEYTRRANPTDRASSISSVGANYSFNPYTKLKTQCFYTKFYAYDEPDAPEVKQDNFITLDTRFVMAF